MNEDVGEKPGEVFEKDGIDKTNKQSYYDAVSSTSYQILKRTSGSMSSAKDDQEVLIDKSKYY